jgi:3-hydroxyisobutyrate dehydrogenase
MAKDDKIKCGFIGLGNQGAPIAERMIAAGYPVILWARRPESLEPYKDTGAEFASSIAELARQVEHVGVCVVNDNDLLQVCGELIPALRDGTRIAVHSTVHPDTVRQLARDAADRGVFVIDAPVSGGEIAAKAGTLTVMVGGEAQAVASARPVFETFGSLILHLGEAGAGQNAKLINNALLAANMAMADHALTAGSALGIEIATLVELLSASSGRSYGQEVRGQMSGPRAFGHAGALLLKNVRLLQAVLGEDPGATGLANAAGPFLAAWTGGRT